MMTISVITKNVYAFVFALRKVYCLYTCLLDIVISIYVYGLFNSKNKFAVIKQNKSLFYFDIKNRFCYFAT